MWCSLSHRSACYPTSSDTRSIQERSAWLVCTACSTVSLPPYSSPLCGWLHWPGRGEQHRCLPASSSNAWPRTHRQLRGLPPVSKGRDCTFVHHTHLLHASFFLLDVAGIATVVTVVSPHSKFTGFGEVLQVMSRCDQNSSSMHFMYSCSVKPGPYLSSTVLVHWYGGP